MSDAREWLEQLHAESANDTDMPRGRLIHALTAALLATMVELDRLDEERRRGTEQITWGEARTFRRVDIRQIIAAALEPLDCGQDVVTVIHREPDGTWWAESPELEGFTAVAETPEALRELIAEGVDFHLDEIDRLRTAAKAATSGSPVVDALSDAGIDAAMAKIAPIRMTDAEYEEWCDAMDEIKGRPPGTTLEAGRPRCRASMTVTGWPTRRCVEPEGHDGPHYAGNPKTRWGVTWFTPDPGVQCCEVGRECDVHAAALALADKILPTPHCCGDWECGFVTPPDRNHCGCFEQVTHPLGACQRQGRKRDGSLSEVGEA